MRADEIQPEQFVNLRGADGFPMIGPHRFVMLGFPGFARLERDLSRRVGRKTLIRIMARLGYEVGLIQGTHFRESGVFKQSHELLKAGAVLRQILGLAREEIQEFQFEPELQLLSFKGIWHDSIEVDSSLFNQDEERKMNCAILAGMASGYTSVILGREFLVKETTCRAAGDDHCRFEGRLVSDWDMDPDEIQDVFRLGTLEEEVANLEREYRKTLADLKRHTTAARHDPDQVLKHSAEHGIISRSRAMARLLTLSEKVAPTESTVLIQGESGTGKEMVARFIHLHSAHRDGPFMAINCAALPANLLESELFGHRKGAFSGATRDHEGLFVEAGEGTLFLDEVAELPLDLQPKLLRAIQEKQVRPVGGTQSLAVKARIIAATNQDLSRMAVENRFRDDLYYRLSVFPLSLPPLRERKGDIPALALHFLSKLNAGKAGFTQAALQMMERHNWPGNVRELENWVEYAVIMAGHQKIEPEHLPAYRMQDPGDAVQSMASDMPTLKQLEKRYIEMVLRHTSNNKGRAASILGLSHSTLWRRLRG
jgi:DNA-binding NtrC family response regulator/predicted hydrocarbon binding protein